MNELDNLKKLLKKHEQSLLMMINAVNSMVEDGLDIDDPSTAPVWTGKVRLPNGEWWMIDDLQESLELLEFFRNRLMVIAAHGVWCLFCGNHISRHRDTCELLQCIKDK
jgi:hypothetical protein